MKKLLIIVGIVLLGYIAFQKVPTVRHLLSYTPCSTPLTYRIGFIDNRFGLSKANVLTDVNQAADIWNQAEFRPIFAYDPQGKITVNLVYDQRQRLSSQINQLQQKLDSDKSNLDPQIQDYQARSATFDKKIADLNAQIDYWNSKGGAPADEYQKIIQEQQDLRKEAQELNTIAYSLNQSKKDYNSQISQLNQTEQDLKQTLVLKPEEGLWNGNDDTISIYFNNTPDELIHTLAHEFGHARGLDHNTNAASIMYPSSTEVITPSGDDLSALNEICKERSDFELIVRGYISLIHSLENKFQPAPTN